MIMNDKKSWWREVTALIVSSVIVALLGWIASEGIHTHDALLVLPAMQVDIAATKKDITDMKATGVVNKEDFEKFEQRVDSFEQAVTDWAQTSFDGHVPRTYNTMNKNTGNTK
jgi:cell division protein FtsB